MISIDSQKLADLIIKYERKALSRKERRLFQSWRAYPGNQQKLNNLLQDESIIQELKQEYQSRKRVESMLISHGIPISVEGPLPAESKRPSRLVSFYRPAAAAAAILILLIAGGIVWFTHQHNPARQQGMTISSLPGDLPPGGNHARLVLSNGSSISLDSAQNGLLTSTDGADVDKTRDGQLQYAKNQSQNYNPSQPAAFNTLITPRGGQYFVQLSDGSKIWLNAASSLHYPVKFTGEKRNIDLTGEAYFEIAPDPHAPFMVSIPNKAGATDPTKIEVLGTHFNVNSYSDETSIKTTLLEGSVSVVCGDAEVTIKPGQQANITDGSKIAVVNNADLDEAVSWKNGITSFKNADIHSIMRRISRWYDIDIAYEGQIPAMTFMGGIPRDSKLSAILKVLELNHIHFQLTNDNKRLIIRP